MNAAEHIRDGNYVTVVKILQIYWCVVVKNTHCIGCDFG